jgi:isohexenylglutaconyl-CoA hydratase
MNELPQTRVVRLEWRGPCLVMTLDDPATRNALTSTMLEDLQHVLDATRGELSLRALVIQGKDGLFCAGGNLKGVVSGSRSAGEGSDGVREENRRAGLLFHALNSHSSPVVAVVDGPAMGGGFGLVCCADIVITTPRARFALSETRVGLAPAQIAPFVIARVGLSAARRLALTGLRLDAEAAAVIGLSDYPCANAAEASARLEQLLGEISQCGPRANACTKSLLLEIARASNDAIIDRAAEIFANCVRSDEGREGISAFIEKRSPSWVDTK